MLYGNTIHFQYQEHVWGRKPCKWGRDTLFNCSFWTLGQCFISNESMKYVFPFCALSVISPILTSLFTQNKTQLAGEGRQQTRGSGGEMMRQLARAAKYLDGVRLGSMEQLWLVTVLTLRLHGKAAPLLYSRLPTPRCAFGQHGRIAQTCCLRP